MLRDKKEELISENKVNLRKKCTYCSKKRYLKKDEDGNVIENPEDLFYRVAENIAQADKIYDKDTDKLY